MKRLYVCLLLAALTGCRTRPNRVAGIARCGGINHSYRVRPYLEVARRLQELGKSAAVGQLREEAKTGKNDERVIILCRMLFESKNGKEFRRPLIGAACFLGDTTYKDWPLEPISIHEGVPFLVVWGYELAGVPERASWYLEYCVRSCDWSDTGFRLHSNEELEAALESFLQSGPWNRPLDEREIDFLRSQIR